MRKLTGRDLVAYVSGSTAAPDTENAVDSVSSPRR